MAERGRGVWVPGSQRHGHSVHGGDRPDGNLAKSMQVAGCTFVLVEIKVL